MPTYERWRHQKAPVEGLLKRVANENIVLLSSGGSDWLHGTGKAERVEGGYRINARKIFASGAPAGDLQGARYLPLQEGVQRELAARIALGEDPDGPSPTA